MIYILSNHLKLYITYFSIFFLILSYYEKFIMNYRCLNDFCLQFNKGNKEVLR